MGGDSSMDYKQRSEFWDKLLALEGKDKIRIRRLFGGGFCLFLVLI